MLMLKWFSCERQGFLQIKASGYLVCNTEQIFKKVKINLKHRATKKLSCRKVNYNLFPSCCSFYYSILTILVALRSAVQTWLLCYVLEPNTLCSRSLSPPKGACGYSWIVRETWGVTLQWTGTTIQGGVGQPRQHWPLSSGINFTYICCYY